MSEKIDTDKVKSIDNPFTIMNYIYYIIDYTNRLKGLFSERQEKRTKAMKIETTIVSKTAGVVEKVYVSEGEKVNSEDLLVTFKL